MGSPRPTAFTPDHTHGFQHVAMPASSLSFVLSQLIGLIVDGFRFTKHSSHKTVDSCVSHSTQAGFGPALHDNWSCVQSTELLLTALTTLLQRVFRSPYWGDGQAHLQNNPSAGKAGSGLSYGRHDHQNSMVVVALDTLICVLLSA